MEVMVGPAFSIGVSPSTPDAYVRDRSGTLPPAQPGLFEDDEKRDMTRNGFEPGYDISGQLKRQLDDEVSSDDSSSIGDPNADDSEEDAVLSSKLSSSLASLEDALPIKRGLSNHFSGKSKSFATLSEVDSTNSEVKVLEKPENPFNKRRRVLIGSKWSRKSSSFYNWANNPKSMPLLPLNEHGDEVAEERNDPSSSEDKDEEEEDDNYDERRRRAVKFHEKTRFITSNNFRSRSCFSLADLRQN